MVIGKMPIGEPFVTVNAVSESISFHMCRLSDLTYDSFVNVITI